jgi:glutamate dehydrogenase
LVGGARRDEREGDIEMAVKAGDLEQDLIDSLTESVAERLEGESPVAYREFVRQYYHWVPAKDLADRRPEDLAGAIVAHWRIAHQREPGEVKVSVYNPDRVADGWQSPYTAIEIVSDDMPFIVDSVTMELGRQGYGIELVVHPVMRVVRDDDGVLQEVLASGATAFGYQTESVLHVEVARQAASERLAVLHSGIEVVLEEVRAAVEDWGAMRARTIELATELRRQAPPCGSHELAETEAFLDWLANDHFTFLGYREYQLGRDGSPGELSAVEGSGLGILRGASAGPPKQLRGRALREALSSHPLVLTKANSRSTVHRPAYLDYVGVKRFAPDGRVVG